VQLFIRNNPVPDSVKGSKSLLVIEILGLGEGRPWFKIFLAIQTSSLDKCYSTLRGTGQQDEINRKKLLILNPHDISNDHLAPFNLHETPIPEDPSLELMVELLVRFVSLVVLVAYIKQIGTLSQHRNSQDDSQRSPSSERAQWTDNGYCLQNTND
jgi:hypothetical protein